LKLRISFPAMSFRALAGLSLRYSKGGNAMPEHTVGTREEWKAADFPLRRHDEY
jgi:hypothetical protein